MHTQPERILNLLWLTLTLDLSACSRTLECLIGARGKPLRWLLPIWSQALVWSMPVVELTYWRAHIIRKSMAYLRIRPNNLPLRWKFRRLKYSALSITLNVQTVTLSFYLFFKIFVSGMVLAWKPFKYNLISIRGYTN